MAAPARLHFITEDDSDAIGVLEGRMRVVYQDPTAYPPFNGESCQPQLWSIVIERARTLARALGRQCRVLEIGSGRSGFNRSLAEAGLWKSDTIHYTAHDVTDANLDFLRERADETVIGAIERINGPFDIVFHSYVLEHVVRPGAFFEKVFTLIPPHGQHIFSCPRYDALGISPPSVRHFGLLGRLQYALFSIRRALAGAPRFPLLVEPAILHGPYFRDADAIHCVALRDILWWHRDRAAIRQFRIPAYSLKDWLVKRLMGLNLIITKNGEPPTPRIPAPPARG